MRMPSKAKAAADAAARAKYIVNGVIDREAIAQDAASHAARLWSGKHCVYKSEVEMAAGFEREILERIGA